MSRFSGSHYNNSESTKSGWTGYFEESLFETEGRLIKQSMVDYDDRREEEEEMDLSMISDASSVPRNVYYDQENCQSVKGKRKQYMGLPNQYSCLDDTASSSVCGLTKREMNPYAKESCVENGKELTQRQSRKADGKKQTSSFFQFSTKKLPKN